MGNERDNCYQVKEIVNLSPGVKIVFTVNKMDGKELDTLVSLDGEFLISGSQKEEFSEKLGDLINEYRI